MSNATEDGRRRRTASVDSSRIRRGGSSNRPQARDEGVRRQQPTRRRAQSTGATRGQAAAASGTKATDRSATLRRSSTANRAVGVEPARPTPRTREGERDTRSSRPADVRQGLPVIPTLVAFVVAIAITSFVTRSLVLKSVGGSAGSGAAEVAAASSAEGEGTSQVQSGDATQDDDSSADARTSTSKETSSETSTRKDSKSGNGVKSPWITSGTFTTGDATLDEEVKEFCDGIATTDMDIDTAALEVYKGVAWSEYVERDDAQHPAGKDWRIEYARQYYENDRSGNCYEFAAFLSYCLQYLGLEDAHAEAVILELKSGDWGDHGLVYVTNTDGTPSLCDTSLGTNGWMLKETAYNVQIQDVEND
ncbi:MAG: hypothetical protein IKG18_17015 [Atopobiaceae bacterium]|nr:hypothetical protein [Atopobiaceae bacterium]